MNFIRCSPCVQYMLASQVITIDVYAVTFNLRNSENVKSFSIDYDDGITQPATNVYEQSELYAVHNYTPGHYAPVTKFFSEFNGGGISTAITANFTIVDTTTIVPNEDWLLIDWSNTTEEKTRFGINLDTTFGGIYATPSYMGDANADGQGNWLGAIDLTFPTLSDNWTWFDVENLPNRKTHRFALVKDGGDIWMSTPTEANRNVPGFAWHNYGCIEYQMLNGKPAKVYTPGDRGDQQLSIWKTGNNLEINSKYDNYSFSGTPGIAFQLPDGSWSSVTAMELNINDPERWCKTNVIISDYIIMEGGQEGINFKIYPDVNNPAIDHDWPGSIFWHNGYYRITTDFINN